MRIKFLLKGTKRGFINGEKDGESDMYLFPIIGEDECWGRHSPSSILTWQMAQPPAIPPFEKTYTHARRRRFTTTTPLRFLPSFNRTAV
ncbi:hypothetical protein L6452_20609 [Arctium lappa]|uniref:Uncharacterized protein n=1 Tax=Arctium lappa TaxID=4217 RepID=A0ACB9BB31_ARCLA|nr:hypothetical protein L6452_20609 [Arctium lappa]